MSYFDDAFQYSPEISGGELDLDRLRYYLNKAMKNNEYDKAVAIYDRMARISELSFEQLKDRALAIALAGDGDIEGFDYTTSLAWKVLPEERREEEKNNWLDFVFDGVDKILASICKNLINGPILKEIEEGTQEKFKHAQDTIEYCCDYLSVSEEVKEEKLEKYRCSLINQAKRVFYYWWENRISLDYFKDNNHGTYWEKENKVSEFPRMPDNNDFNLFGDRCDTLIKFGEYIGRVNVYSDYEAVDSQYHLWIQMALILNLCVNAKSFYQYGFYWYVDKQYSDEYKNKLKEKAKACRLLESHYLDLLRKLRWKGKEDELQALESQCQSYSQERNSLANEGFTYKTKLEEIDTEIKYIDKEIYRAKFFAFATKRRLKKRLQLLEKERVKRYTLYKPYKDGEKRRRIDELDDKINRIKKKIG